MKRLLAILALIAAPAFGAFPLDISFIDTGSTEWALFKSWVDLHVGGNNQWGFEATNAGMVFNRIGGTQYREVCADEARAQYTNAMADINDPLDGTPPVAGDSYLKVGPYIRDIILALVWCNDSITATEEANWLDYAEQAVWNVWNPTLAEWGGNPFPWSGWSTSNPGNNYHFSFLEATMYLGFYQDDVNNDPTWLDYLTNNKITPLRNYYNDLDGGGSLEGTGYGVAQRRLFSLYRLWEDGTSEQLWDGGTHLSDSVDYWTHATTPGGGYFAPFGDHARSSMPSMYDYYRHLVLEARYLLSGTQQQKASWWLHNITVQQMTANYNRDDNLLPSSGTQTAPTDLYYHATGVGNIFWRSDWSDEALWFAFIGGPFDESHAHHEQGSFTIWHNGWEAVTTNIYSASGINQGPDNKNLVAFCCDASSKSSGLEIPQSRQQTPATITWTPEYDGAGTFKIVGDFQSTYATRAKVNDWDRTIEFDGSGEFLITDTFDIDAGTTATWQLNTADQPSILGGGTYAETTNLRVTPISPAGATIAVNSWATIDPAHNYSDGWRIEITGSTTGYTVQVDVLSFGDVPPPPEEASPGAAIPIGATITGADINN